MYIFEYVFDLIACLIRSTQVYLLKRPWLYAHHSIPGSFFLSLLLC